MYAVVSVILAVAFVLSLALFLFTLTVKQRNVARDPAGMRRRSRQTVGTVFALLGLLLYLPTFSDRLPGFGTGLRSTLRALPDLGRLDTTFHSSTWAEWALIVVFAFRSAVYVTLFVIPARTLNDTEYYSPERVEERANDYTAPVLSYLAFAITLAAAICGPYRLPAYVGPVLVLALEFLYFGSRLIRRLRRLLVRIIIELRILLRTVVAQLNSLVVVLIVLVGRLEKWRTGGDDDDDDFMRTLRKRLDDQKVRIRQQNERDRGRLRGLADEQE